MTTSAFVRVARETAVLLDSESVTVTVTDFDEKNAHLVAKELQADGHELTFLRVEVTADSDWDDLVANTAVMERLLGPAARRVLESIEEGPHGGAVRTQAGVVRSLVDELERPLAASSKYLCDQVKEELVRLMRLVRDASQ